jgi:hypothetical protein
MERWSSTSRANATPERLLEVLTHPQQIRHWSPFEFEMDDLASRRLVAGTRTQVSGRLAGVRVTFEVHVHAADTERLALSAEGPIGLDVCYELASDHVGAEMTASVRVRTGKGLTGRLVASAVSTLLTAGALDGATGRIARAAEAVPYAAAA